MPDLRVCFLGDSLVAGVGDPDGLGWVGRLVAGAFAAGAPLTAYPLGIRRQTSLLSSTNRDVPERHRTLWATMAWSYDLLDERGQCVFRHLGTFAGSFDAEAAAAVCEPALESSVSARAAEVLDAMLVLADKSLLRTEQHASGGVEQLDVEIRADQRDPGLERLDGRREVLADAAHPALVVLAAGDVPDDRQEVLPWEGVGGDWRQRELHPHL